LTIAQAQLTEDAADYDASMLGVVDRLLDAYLHAVEGRPEERPDQGVLHRMLSRQQLADLSGVRASTIQYYTDVGLLPFQQAGAGLARRYDEVEATARLRRIAALQATGLDLDTVRERLESSGSR
jgi:hypothetical protein